MTYVLDMQWPEKYGFPCTGCGKTTMVLSLLQHHYFNESFSQIILVCFVNNYFEESEILKHFLNIRYYLYSHQCPWFRVFVTLFCHNSEFQK